MAGNAAQLTFFGWEREKIAGLVAGVTDGRARVECDVKLIGTDADGAATSTENGKVTFLLAGPADVVGLVGGPIRRRYPTPGTIDHESDRCPHVELSDCALPWRYTPALKPAPNTGTQHPWLVLVVGIEGEELTLSADQVSLNETVQLAYPLGAASAPYLWAHVQRDEAGRGVARVLSGRPLEASTDYVAVLVPAFDATGAPRWKGSGSVTVPLYDHWRFRTATPKGSFEDLAARLKPGAAAPTTGRAPLDYPRVPEAADLEVRGAMAPLGAVDAPLDPAVGADLDALRSPAKDEKGRPIVGLPRYGEAWRIGAPERPGWGAQLNTDPRDRGVAGLGLEIGIRLQEELAEEAAAHLGALAEVRQRIRDLVLGLQASIYLWTHRMPADPNERLWLLGPALARVVTPDGALADLVTADDRPLPRGIFSTAARRILRPGPARTALLDGTWPSPKGILDAANSCPPPDKPAYPLPLGAALDPVEVAGRLREVLERGIDLSRAAKLAAELAERAHAGDVRNFAKQIATRLANATKTGAPAPWVEAMALLEAAADATAADQHQLEELVRQMRALLAREPWGDQDLADVFDVMADPPPVLVPCQPVDLDGLATALDAIFDPRGPNGPALVRVLDTIGGLDPTQPLAPPEVCIGLDRPVWADLRDAFAEWLLPGVGALPEDSVIAVETNPRFIDALLTGLNTQLLAELRWRNIPIATGCTPLRVFWDRADTGTGQRIDDITGIHAWPDASPLGDLQHRPGGASGRDLVVLIRGHLFLRYPSTLVYLTPAVLDTTQPDWTQDPDLNARILPSFQGRIGADVTFFGFQGFEPKDINTHWLVFEEPPAGYRFRNDQPHTGSPPPPQTWAANNFVRPVRVLVQGDSLDPEG